MRTWTRVPGVWVGDSVEQRREVRGLRSSHAPSGCTWRTDRQVRTETGRLVG